MCVLMEAEVARAINSCRYSIHGFTVARHFNVVGCIYP